MGIGGSGVDQEDSRVRVLDGEQVDFVGESVQASPNIRKAWSSTQVADYFRRRIFHLLQMEEAGRRSGPAGSICAVGGGTESAGRIHKEEDEDSILNQAYPELFGPRQQSDAVPKAEKGKGKGPKGKTPMHLAH